jgi:Ca-activated chloride channel family protein
MSFAAPTLLLALLIVPFVILVYVLYEMRREKRAATWVNPNLAPNLVHRPSFRLRHIPAALFLIGLTLLLVGFARPEATFDSVRPGSTIIFAIDTSGSMAANDVPPTRLGAADNAIQQFMTVLPKQYKVGMVTFNDHPAVTVLPTYDHKLLALSVPKKSKESGTQLGSAIQKAVQVAVRSVGPDRPGKPHPPAAIVLFSDGKQTQPGISVETAVTYAHRVNVPVSTAALGTAGGTVKQGQILTGGLDQRQTIPVPVDPVTLHSIATATNGRYAQIASPGALQLLLHQVYLDLGQHAAHEHDQHEVTAAATGLALLFIVPAIILSGLWFRRVA